MKVPITKPFLDWREAEAVRKTLETGWLVQGPRVSGFEQMVADFCRIPFAVAASSCTTALHLCLIHAGIGPGKQVMVPAFTYVATANAVEQTGARSVFVDIEKDTLNISPLAVQECLEKLLKADKKPVDAIIPVHLFGLCADMGEIVRISREHPLTIIEDAACALGSSINGESPGHFGHSACYSFHPRKVVTTGEGGMAVTRDEHTAKNLRILRDHGAEKTDHQRHLQRDDYLPEFNQPGFNYRMTDIQGALGECQMKKLSDILKSRHELAKNYDMGFAEVPWLKTPKRPEGYVHSYQSYVCRIVPEKKSVEEVSGIRDSLFKHLRRAGVSAVPGTHAVHQLGYYRKKYQLKAEQYPNAWLAHNNTVTLPLYPEMTEEIQNHVIKTVLKFNPRP